MAGCWWWPCWVRNATWKGSAVRRSSIRWRARAAWGGQAQGQSQLLILATELEHCFTTGRFEDSLAALERLQEAAKATGAEPFTGLAHFYFGANHHYLGNLQLSETGFAQVRAWLTPEQRAKLRGLIGLDVEVVGLAISARNLWLLGYPEQALARSRQALASAAVTGAVLGQAGAVALGAGLLCCLRHDEPGMAELSEECYRLSQKHGLIMWAVYSEVLRGRVQFGRGEHLAGIEHMWGVGWQHGNVATETDFFATMVADSCLAALRQRAPAAGAISPTERSRLLTIGQGAIDSMLGGPECDVVGFMKPSCAACRVSCCSSAMAWPRPRTRSSAFATR